MIKPPPPAHLFRMGMFLAKSGGMTPWTIACETMNENDWYWAARMVRDRYEFRKVFALSGGFEFQKQLETMITPEADTVLIVDDLLVNVEDFEHSAGHIRLNTEYGLNQIVGICLFARVKPPGWVRPIFQFWAD